MRGLLFTCSAAAGSAVLPIHIISSHNPLTADHYWPNRRDQL